MGHVLIKPECSGDSRMQTPLRRDGDPLSKRSRTSYKIIEKYRGVSKDDWWSKPSITKMTSLIMNLQESFMSGFEEPSVFIVQNCVYRDNFISF